MIIKKIHETFISSNLRVRCHYNNKICFLKVINVKNNGDDFSLDIMKYYDEKSLKIGE